MDIRVQKTKGNIYDAFMEIRSKKPLEKITVKELCEAAKINKSTFYVYYKDLYDLSDKIENEIVTSVVKNLGSTKDIIDDSANFSMMLCNAYASQQNMIATVFSGIRMEQLPRKIEATIKEAFFEVYPQYRDDVDINMKLTYCIYGGYYAFNAYRTHGEKAVVELIGSMSAKIFDK
ncbi:MAG: TetR/AcrR family transcriptional regulator [Oscillospiraceae bacterium]|nr:TetR/AcrR family transcriptional regulator [Oscillospiraceae bacterium]